MKLLIEAGNSVQARDQSGAIPLHFAAANGHSEAVAALIAFGSDIDVRNSLGQSPFNLASERKQVEVVKLLKRAGADQSPPNFPTLRGEYLGQQKPGTTPALFAPGLVSSYAPVHGCVTFSPDLLSFYWSIVDFEKRGSTILQMSMDGDRWSAPETASFASHFSDDVPFFSPDGSRLYFLSSRPPEDKGALPKENIWFLERETAADSWSKPRMIGPEINQMDLHWQFSVALDQAIYFSSSSGKGRGLNDIYCAKYSNQQYLEPENLGDSINSEHADFAPLISPDQNYLIFSSTGRPDGFGEVDLYISFRRKNGSWTPARNFGPSVNTERGELLSTLSPDGRFLFYTGRRDGRKGVFWVNSGLIERLKEESCPKE
jgi:hypothetical protein